MNFQLNSPNNRIILLAMMVTIFTLNGCGHPADKREQISPSAETSNTRSVNPNTGQIPSVLREPCVGMGCDGKVSAGLQEKCVGMGCPSDTQ